MALDFQVDLTPFLKTCDDMVQQLSDFPRDKMAEELTNWQRDDMHRKYPETAMPDDHTVETDIWPRSRLPQRWRPTGRLRGRPKGAKTQFLPKQPKGAKPITSSQHPILRPDLYDKMHDRMTQLLQTIRWKTF